MLVFRRDLFKTFLPASLLTRTQNAILVQMTFYLGCLSSSSFPGTNQSITKLIAIHVISNHWLKIIIAAAGLDIKSKAILIQYKSKCKSMQLQLAHSDTDNISGIITYSNKCPVILQNRSSKTYSISVCRLKYDANLVIILLIVKLIFTVTAVSCDHCGLWCLCDVCVSNVLV